jgi:hypothetical protein
MSRKEGLRTSEIAVGTVFAKNYLSMGRVFADSFRRRHPDIPVFALLCDEPDGRYNDEPFQLLGLDELDFDKSDLYRLRFLYSRQQLASAMKPPLLSYLLNHGFDAAVFLYPDTLVLNDLSGVFKAVRSHPLTLTPHLLAPAKADNAIRRERAILQSGVYNGGLIGVSDRPGARHFLSWWQDRVRDHCRHAVAEGAYFDQRWLDLAAVFVEDVCHLPSLTLEDIDDAANLFRRYRDLLIAAGHHETKSRPYAYDHFDNGAPVTDTLRQHYRELGAAAKWFGDPLRTAAPGSFFEWVRQRIPA